MKLISYYLVYPLGFIVGWLPFKGQLIVSDFMRWILYKVVKYRLRVVRDNLKKSFPEKTHEQLLKIEKDFYKHLADVFLETLILVSMSKKEMLKRIVFLNVDQVENENKGKSWICAMAHYANWEYTISYAMHCQNDGVLAVYKPLRDKGFDKLYYHIRSRFGAMPTSMSEVGRIVINGVRSGKRYAVALISDQNPPLYENSQWVDFLGQKTLFYGGMEKFALKFKMPVAFLHLNKDVRGYYVGWFEMIYDGVEPVEEGEITRRYANKLDETIRQRPELWMWSHKRWKYNYEKDRLYYETRKQEKEGQD